jgi:glyoxylase I family protein
MAESLTLGPVHHIALRVTQRDRSVDFYQTVCGFQVVAALPDVTLLSNGTLLLGLRDQAGSDDRFDEFRVGLDHLSFTLGSRAELVDAVAILDQHQVAHGDIEDMQAFGLSVVAFRDPDNIQLELTSPYSG